MSYIIKVLVQMPDGSFKRLPVVSNTDNGLQVVTQPTKKEAYNWAEVILPERMLYEEKP